MTKRQKIRKLVQNILNENTQKADKMLQYILNQAEDEREEQAEGEAKEQLGIPDQGQTETDDATDQKETNQQEQDLFSDEDGENQDEFTDIEDDGESEPQETQDEFGPGSEEEQLANDTELNDAVDKQVNFEVQINNLVLNDLQNKCSNLKTLLENDTTLDKHSREYYEIQVPLQYYAEHLSEMKKNVSPLVNQDDIKKQLDEIKISLDELSSKISSEEDVTKIDSPNQIIERDLKPEF